MTKWLFLLGLMGCANSKIPEHICFVDAGYCVIIRKDMK